MIYRRGHPRLSFNPIIEQVIPKGPPVIRHGEAGCGALRISGAPCARSGGAAPVASEFKPTGRQVIR